MYDEVCVYHLTNSTLRAVIMKLWHTSGSWHAVKFHTYIQEYVSLCTLWNRHNTNKLQSSNWSLLP